MERSQRKPSHLYLVVTGTEAPRAREAGLEKAEQLMRAEPERRWTVSSLARRAGMSRAVFARKFGVEFGRSPLRYLTEVRMERAAELLRASDLPLAEVAERVGYASEFAFNRAFKRHFLLPPGGYRRNTRPAGDVTRLAA
jgi:transcriptional regulator GlxA family with amidase domain